MLIFSDGNVLSGDDERFDERHQRGKTRSPPETRNFDRGRTGSLSRLIPASPWQSHRRSHATYSLLACLHSYPLDVILPTTSLIHLEIRPHTWSAGNVNSFEELQLRTALKMQAILVTCLSLSTNIR